MLYKSSLRYRLTGALLMVLALGGSLLPTPFAGQAAVPEPRSASYPIVLYPDQLTLTGNVATRDNSKGQCTAPWLANTPVGSIILGVNPQSCNPADWNGGTATAQIVLPDIYGPTVLALKIAWPDRDGKGIHSPEKNRTASIFLDSRRLWDIRTTSENTFGDFYAAEHNPILTTIVLTQTAVHTLRFVVPPHTAWDISQIELSAYPVPKPIKGIGYSPYRDCQAPGGSLQPSTQNIEDDLFRLMHTSSAIRTYAATGVNRQIPALANAVGLPVYAGAWLDGNGADDAEAQALIDLANTTKLAGAIVGNEFYLRHRTNDDLRYLGQRIQQVRAGITDKHLPLMTAEIDGFMFDWQDDAAAIIKGIKPAYKPILDSVDVVLVHIYPFWNGLPIDGAAMYTVNHYNAIRALITRTYPGKRVIIGETGWPSAGNPNGTAIPSLENQRRYMLEFLILAEQNNVEFMYFDTFDELWKIEEPGRVGQNWGYTYSDHTVKHSFNSVLLPKAELLSHRVYLPLINHGSPSLNALRPPDAVMPQIPPKATRDDLLFPVYTEWLADPQRFVPVGWMGDTQNITMFECHRENPHSGDMAIRATFSPTGTLGWGGISWQDPASNWGKQLAGYNLTGARRLSFWMRGARGGEAVEFQVGGLGETTDPYHDTLRPARSTRPIVLTDQWQKVEIDLAGADLSRIAGGFSWVASRCYNSSPITFYLDDIQFDFNNAPDPSPIPPHQLFYVYDDRNSGCTHFAPSGFMGDIEDLTLDTAWSGAPFRGSSATEVAYTAQQSRSKGWAGIYWQEPENNWGTIDGGYNLSWANKLTFRARGAQGGERVQFFVGGIGTKAEPYPDSLRPALSTGFISLDTSWREYTIDLRGRNLAHVIGGFGLVMSKCADSGGATVYLDDIVYEFDPSLPLTPPPGAVFPVYTDAAARENHYVPSLWMGDGSVPGQVSMNECWQDGPYSGLTSIRIAYTQQQQGWAGMYWVHPAENRGDIPGGFDLTGADHLTFWARSDTPAATITFLIGGVGYDTDYQGNTVCSRPLQPYPDSVCPPIRQTVALSSTWAKYTIDLKQSPMRDLSSVVGGFGWMSTSPVVFYLDDIVYEFDQ
jgi:exo-beta-1,3-glucanase (GH17 family)